MKKCILMFIIFLLTLLVASITEKTSSSLETENLIAKEETSSKVSLEQTIE